MVWADIYEVGNVFTWIQAVNCCNGRDMESVQKQQHDYTPTLFVFFITITFIAITFFQE